MIVSIVSTVSALPHTKLLNRLAIFEPNKAQLLSPRTTWTHGVSAIHDP